MTSAPPQTSSVTIRPFQYRDLEEVTRMMGASEADTAGSSEASQRVQQLRRWYGLLKCLSLFPNPFQHSLSAYVAEQDGQLCGMVQVSPFNRTRSTWKVDQVWVNRSELQAQTLAMDVGSQLLRHCFQTIWEARTWIIEVNVNDSETLALYRQNGFQTLAHLTYWELSPELVQALAVRETDLPNLLPVSNADATLLHQLDTVSMPPLVRQVFDRHVADFKTGFMGSVMRQMRHWMHQSEQVRGYVFESQRKAAIGYYELQLCRHGHRPHAAHLTVHPAYTWLYPELFAQMAKGVRELPTQSLRVASTDYQPEREAFLERIGATRIEHTLMMSRSVWHKLRESRFSLEGLQLSEVLQGFQPARQPIPGRFSLLDSIRPQATEKSESPTPPADSNNPLPPENS